MRAWASATETVYDRSGEVVRNSSGGITVGLFVVTLLMIVFRARYPRWWFDFALELTRFSARVCAYFVLLSDQYPRRSRSRASTSRSTTPASSAISTAGCRW